MPSWAAISRGSLSVAFSWNRKPICRRRFAGLQVSMQDHSTNSFCHAPRSRAMTGMCVRLPLPNAANSEKIVTTGGEIESAQSKGGLE